jgi:ribosomal-protein-alanine N-acetyltransferase
MNRIEKLGPQYAREIEAIVKDYQAQLENRAQLNWDFNSISEVVSGEKVIGLIYYDEKTSYIELLAFIIYRDLFSIAEVLLLGTKKERQSQGLMTTLINSLKGDYVEIWLEVHELNTKALQFYEKERFKIDGVRLKYYTDGKSALVMSWKRVLAIC